MNIFMGSRLFAVDSGWSVRGAPGRAERKHPFSLPVPSIQTGIRRSPETHPQGSSQCWGRGRGKGQGREEEGQSADNKGSRGTPVLEERWACTQAQERRGCLCRLHTAGWPQ